MANYIATDTDLTAVANAIRTKGGTSGQLAFPNGFVTAVQNIPTGQTPTGTKEINITEDGTFTEDVSSYASAEITVNVVSGAVTQDQNGYLVLTDQGEGGNGNLDLLLLNQLTTLNTSLSRINISLANVTSLVTLNAPNLTYFKSFDGCTNLENIILPSMVNMYNFNFSFRGTKIRKVFLPNLERLYGAQVFYNCSQLEYFIAPKLGTVANNGNNQQAILNSSTFSNCPALKGVDIYCAWNFGNAFTNDSAFNLLIIRGLRYDNSLTTLINVTDFDGTPFASNGAGGTLYVPQSLISQYEQATNWSTILGYTNNQILPIQGSIYETQYADGTPITS